MPKRWFLLVTVTLLSLFLADLAIANPTKLFNGINLDGWSGSSSSWRVESGRIVGEIPDKSNLKNNEFLFWDGMAHDFDLTLKFKIGGHPTANSGIQYRSIKEPNGGASGYQADLDMGSTWAGRIYDEHQRGLLLERGTKAIILESGVKESTAFKPASFYKSVFKKDQWNKYRIKAVGSRTQVWLNDELTADLTDSEAGEMDLSGKIALQLHSGPGPVRIEFKDIVFHDLGKTPLPEDSKKRTLVRGGVSPKGLNLGFEEGSLEGWSTKGEVWKGNPVKGDTVFARGRGQVSGHDGEFWIGGYEKSLSDQAQGVLTSDSFEVSHPYASFLVGGGSTPKTRVDIILDSDPDNVIFSASGKQMETLHTEWVDLSKYLNKRIKIRVVDESSGPWGHVNFDDFRFHKEKNDQKPARVISSPILNHLVENPADLDSLDLMTSSMWVPKGFEVERIAKQPTVTQPIAFTFDEKGRLWIAEAHSYPQRRPNGKGLDRIIILEDTDGNGTFESKKTFATGLNLVSGLEVGYGGVWVGAAPHLLYFPDKDHNDVPDGEPKILLDGWGYQDTHETLNSFIWGPDGWLYGNQGVFCRSEIGKPGDGPEKRIVMRAGVWRYHPTRHKFEVFSRGGSNQWGIDFNETGHMFITHCRSAWGKGSTTYVIRNGHYWNQSNSHHASFIASGPAGYNPSTNNKFRNFLLASAFYGHGEGGAGRAGSRQIYGGHAHVGTMIYLGNNWPSQYRNQLFTHNLHGHQMNREINRRFGSGYETIPSGKDHLYVPSPEFIGVDLKYGPEGAVYFIDWTDSQHCHNRNLEVWNRADGGVFRMSWKKTFEPGNVDLTSATTQQLVKYVISKNEWYSRTARRLLHERGDKKAVRFLRRQLKKSNDTAEELRLLWTLHLLGDKKTINQSISHDSEEVRAWAIRLSQESGELDSNKLAGLAQNDSSSMVRLEIASSLPQLSENVRWKAARVLATRVEDKDDPFLPKMIWYGIADLVYSDVDKAIEIASMTKMNDLKESIYWYLSRSPSGRESIISGLVNKSITHPAGRVLLLMDESLSQTKNLEAPKNWSTVVAMYQSENTAESINSLSSIFGDEGTLSVMREIMVNKSLPFEKRLSAMNSLMSQGDDKSIDQLIEMLDGKQFRVHVVGALSRFNDPRIPEALIPLIRNTPKKDQGPVIRALASQPISATALLLKIKNGDLKKSILNSLHVRQMQNLNESSLNKLLANVWGKAVQSSEANRKKSAAYLKTFNEAPKWAHKSEDGQEVYHRLCSSCHVINGNGIDLGPELTGSGANGAAYFIENIVDPNSVVGENFQLNIITTKDGSVISGMVADESDQVLSVRTVDQLVNIQKSQVKERNTLEQSMMPAGLLDTLSEKEVVDLLKFLTSN